MKYTRIVILLLLLTLMSGCSLGRSIDTSEDLVTPYQDGAYKVSSLYYNTYGYKESLTINVYEGIINQVSYIETNKNGQLRSEISPSQTWPTCKFSYSQIIQNLYENTLLHQNDYVDAITGATRTAEGYQILLESALKNAENGKPLDETVSKFSDTYSVISDVDLLTGTQERMTVVYKDGVLSDVVIEDLLNGSSYPPERHYSQLINLTKKNQNLNEVFIAGLDTNTINRYNHLLSEIRKIREN